MVPVFFVLACVTYIYTRRVSAVLRRPVPTDFIKYRVIIGIGCMDADNWRFYPLFGIYILAFTSCDIRDYELPFEIIVDFQSRIVEKGRKVIDGG